MNRERMEAKANIRNLIIGSVDYSLEDETEMWYTYLMESMRQAYELGLRQGIIVSLPTNN